MTYGQKVTANVDGDVDFSKYKTITFIGTLHHCVSTNKIQLKKIKAFQGASAGAIIALMLNIHVLPSLMMQYCYLVNFFFFIKKDIRTTFLERIFDGNFNGVTKGETLLDFISSVCKKNLKDF